MQIAKTTIIIFFVCFFEGLSAQTLVGSFQRTNDFDVGVGITFNSDSTFTETTYQHMGGKLIAKGYFSFEGDILNLHYEAVTANKDIQIKKERMERNSGADTIFSLSAEIKMQNKDGTPKPGPTLVLQNKQKEPVLAFMTNDDGSFPPISLHDPYVAYFQISYLANETVEIATDSLFGYRSEISIVFDDSNVEFGRENRVEKWILESWSPGRLVFREAEKGELIVLERE